MDHFKSKFARFVIFCDYTYSYSLASLLNELRREIRYCRTGKLHFFAKIKNLVNLNTLMSKIILYYVLIKTSVGGSIPAGRDRRNRKIFLLKK